MEQEGGMAFFSPTGIDFRAFDEWKEKEKIARPV
jgi:hypothetical protein